jgi:hypothetical protein
MEFLQQLQAYLPQIVILSIIAVMIYKAHKSEDSSFNVFDYIIDPATKKASITRTGQSIGILTATWVVAKMTVAGTLSAEMFAIYLAALGVSEAWSRYLGSKYIQKQEVKEE